MPEEKSYGSTLKSDMASPFCVFQKLRVGNHPATASDDKPSLNKKETG